MTVLLVSATDAEIAPLVARLQYVEDRAPRVKGYTYRGHRLDVLTTGVGMVATAAWCSRALAADRYDLALNFGICGTFDRSIAPGTVVHVVADQMPELGAEDGEAFLSLHDLQLLCENEFPFRNGELVNAAPPDNPALRALPQVTGITVNTVHGAERSIARLLERCTPQVESMEGAAFMYACAIHGVPFAQVRAVSNVVERRNRAAWKIPDAVAALNAAAQRLLDHVGH